MKLRYSIAVLFFFFSCSVLYGQENPAYDKAPKNAVNEGSTEKTKNNNEDENLILESSEAKKELKKKEKRDNANAKKKPKKEGPLLIATNSKEKLERSFEVGEKISYKSKTDKKILRGELEEIDREYVKIDGKRVKISSLVMVKKKFGKTMGWRTVGLTRFAIGTGIAAVGAGIAIFSFQQIDPNSTYVIWGALGTVFGTGVGLVGTHLMLKGAKGMFQSSKLKKEKNWKFSSKL